LHPTLKANSPREEQIHPKKKQTQEEKTREGNNKQVIHKLSQTATNRSLGPGDASRKDGGGDGLERRRRDGE
jgi:hypothetical protein